MPRDFVSDAPEPDRVDVETLVVDVDGFEGPLDLLLTLARSQKVDLRSISILALAEQYMEFVNAAKRVRIELAADYLVMAAWLAYLKSRLLLPPDPEEEGPSGEDLAAHLAFQLERLEAMRNVAARLMGRDQLGRDFFARGMTETLTTSRQVRYEGTLVDLMRAYAQVKTRDDYIPLSLKRPEVLTMEQALDRLRGLVGQAMDWTLLETFLPEGWQIDPRRRRSATASTFAAMLEMVKGGDIALRQDAVFAPIMVKAVKREDHGQRHG